MDQTKAILIAVGKIILAFLFAFILTLVAMIPVVIVIAIMSGGGAGTDFTLDMLLSDPTFTYGSMIAQAAGFLAAVPIMYGLFERRKGWTIGWRMNRAAFADLARGMGIGVVLMAAIFVLMLAAGVIRIDSIRTDAAVWADMAAYLLLFALVALNEELFSRGYVQGLIGYRFGTGAAIICSSLFFSLLHAFNPGALEQPVPLLNIFIAGVLLAVCREVSGTLWLPIGLHFTWNYVQGNVFGFEVSGTKVVSPLQITAEGSPLWSGGSFGAEGSLIATAVMLAAIWYIWSKRKRRLQEQEPCSPQGE
ncbi:CPBP family intramembrane glutamic endopeptidase [Paenibacillus ginsengarvi]|uniref:CPBP family intramembrane glutamic endopeptidase n=1 Tax=Paenibacillus ginsengarvi TaxID=400777 RepID=UPI0013154E6D|nr:CPBP family intramembrane glutamic endopeptidase [Paenibacillus ginsengarvi]